MMNLMVILIPLLLSSSEFVKMGEIELKLPESGAGGEGGGEAETVQPVNLDLGVVISSKGFSLFHYFRNDSSAAAEAADDKKPDIPLKSGVYDYASLNSALAEVKRSVLSKMTGSGNGSMHAMYASINASGITDFQDFESVKIVAEDTIKYETVVAVMDAARVFQTDEGKVPLFPNVSLAGGIVP
jgi:hypothetical protein